MDPVTDVGEPTLLTTLPRGLGALPEAEVAASQHGRILQAITEQVAEHSYSRSTVAGVISAARVSRSAFYSAFTTCSTSPIRSSS